MSRGRDADVVVVGGGPIGLGAAIEARLAGLDVVLLDRRGHDLTAGGLDKACGEGLMPPAVTALRRLGVDVDGLGGRPFAGIRYVAPRTDRRTGARRDAVAQALFRAGPGLGVRRTALSVALTARAREVGVPVITGTAGPGDRLIRPDARGRVEVAGVRASWVLAADGLHSPTRRRLGLDVAPGGARRYGLRRHYAVAPWSDLVEVHWAADAEAYVTPVADDLVGIAVLGPPGIGADDWWQRFPRLGERLAGATPVTSLLGAGPLRQKAARRVSGRVLLVGDAAGYVDAITGEGISLGLTCAREAVACLVGEHPEDYEAAWWRITRRYRWLTGALLAVAARPLLRPVIVPAAARLPRTFAAIVNGLGRDAGPAWPVLPARQVSGR